MMITQCDLLFAMGVSFVLGGVFRELIEVMWKLKNEK